MVEEELNLKEYTQSRIQEGQQEDLDRKKRVDELVNRFENTESPVKVITKTKIYKQPKQKLTQVGVLKKTLGISSKGISLGYRPIKKSVLKKRDQLAIARLRSMLQKKRYENQLEKIRLKLQVEQLKRKGKLPTITPIQQIRFLRPEDYIFAGSPEVIGDINSPFVADIGHADGDIFGNENYFGDEEYFGEDFWGTEFNYPNNDPFTQLNIRVNRQISPLWW